MNYGAIAELNAFYKNKKEEEAINRILANAYENQQAAQPAQTAQPEVPFVDEQANAFNLPQPEGLVEREAVPAREAVAARAGGINIQNALGEMAKAGMGTRALALQQGIEDRNIKLRGQLPSAVQETQWYTGQNPDLQKTHVMLKRAPTVLNLGGNLVVRDPSGGNGESYPVTPKPEQMPEFKGRQAAAVESGKALGEAQSNIGTNLDAISKMKSEVQGFLDTPGYSIIYGKSRYLDPRSYDIGGPAAGAEARRKQLEGAAFGVAINSIAIKGSLSDSEGKKISAAYTRATDPHQSEDDSRQAWNEVLEHLDIAGRRVNQKAGSKDSSKKYRLGDKITKNGKQYMITKINPDGDHDVMPVKK